jgi:hypothetical protein
MQRAAFAGCPLRFFVVSPNAPGRIRAESVENAMRLAQVRLHQRRRVADGFFTNGVPASRVRTMNPLKN